ncbi:hypothetical protein G0Q06_05555 [Puniceicoccales bacterium CK1056]|uniref:Uncharacterized protein n=1 Tax=Oceanipulchritudo coccoides TaxID=2706888 RepID=A0A6B2M2G8_9BACT|nr:hypothetical protein [Oceanipulchritudo coccoides]NDV61910.1 hypothetical protein [Oceanipulchritudo coccoides]
MKALYKINGSLPSLLKRGLYCGWLSASGEEWFIQKAGIPLSLSPSEQATPVTIAIIDDGVRITHEELAPFLWVNPGEVRWNGIDDDGNGLRDDVHGWDFGDREALLWFVTDGQNQGQGWNVQYEFVEAD